MTPDTEEAAAANARFYLARLRYHAAPIFSQDEAEAFEDMTAALFEQSMERENEDG